ncbi:MAG: phage integrase N-terminal SAM-like domain-containing protein [Deltaproteobacteria bacterium]|nr:phage integrase N-terminal SAM-like domain-containing protein [Deltaproteobacteria bacterium]
MEILRRKHYSIRTEDAYVGWITRYIYFHNKRHPKCFKYFIRGRKNGSTGTGVVSFHNFSDYSQYFSD